MYESDVEKYRLDLNGKECVVSISINYDKVKLRCRDIDSLALYVGEYSYDGLCSIAPCFRVHYDINGIKNELAKAMESNYVKLVLKDDGLNIIFNMITGVDETRFGLALVREEDPQTSSYQPPYTPPRYDQARYEPPSNEIPRVQKSITVLRSKNEPRRTEYPPDEMEAPRGSKITSYIKSNYYKEGDINYAFDKYGSYSFGLINSIIKDQREIRENIENEIKNRMGANKIRYNLLYKASTQGDDSMMFHNKCDYHDNTLVLVVTDKGARFGGFTTQSWDGEYIQKKDDLAFVFNLDSKAIYPVKKGEWAIGCYPEYGPVFMGCQIRIYNDFFTRGGTTCRQGLNYSTTKDYELAEEQQKFTVKDLEVYECIAE